MKYETDIFINTNIWLINSYFEHPLITLLLNIIASHHLGDGSDNKNILYYLNTLLSWFITSAKDDMFSIGECIGKGRTHSTFSNHNVFFKWVWHCKIWNGLGGCLRSPSDHLLFFLFTHCQNEPPNIFWGYLEFHGIQSNSWEVPVHTRVMDQLTNWHCCHGAMLLVLLIKNKVGVC